MLDSTRHEDDGMGLVGGKCRYVEDRKGSQLAVLLDRWPFMLACSRHFVSILSYSYSNIRRLFEKSTRNQVIMRSLNWLEELDPGERSGALEKIITKF